MILCLGTTPAAQRVMLFKQLRVDHVNRAVTTLDGAAGKSINVAKVLHALGAPCVATGFLGGERGESMRRLLEARGIDLDFVPVTTPTRQCITVIDQSAGTVTELVEESRPVEAAAYDQLLAIAQRHVPRCKAMVLSGTIASGGPTDLYLRCVRMANASDAIAIVDASGQALLEALEARPALVKPNRAELEATIGRELKRRTDLMEAVQALHRRGAQRVVITAGAEPALAFDGSEFWQATAPQVAARNPVGSGDSFTAAFTWRLTLSDSFPEALRWAVAAGAANAMTDMAGEVDPEEVKRLAQAVKVEKV